MYGLAPESSVSDSDIFIDVCDVEFGFKPDIVKTTRLGKINPGKIQPLLVSLKNDQETKQLLNNARNPRNSSSEFTRNNIFLSAQQTRAERQAAYEARCHRREHVRQPSKIASSRGRRRLCSYRSCTEQLLGLLRDTARLSTDLLRSRSLGQLTAYHHLPLWLLGMTS